MELESEFCAVSPVHQGQVLLHGVQMPEQGDTRSALDECLAGQLNARGLVFTSMEYDRKEVRSIREKLAYVAMNTASEVAKALPEATHQLLDGQEIAVGNERFLCMEGLFSPATDGACTFSSGSLTRFFGEGLHCMARDAVVACDTELRAALLANVVLSGELSTCPGLAERLQNELAALHPDGPPVAVHALPERHLLPWVGGSKLAALSAGDSAFKGMCVTAQEYAHEGASAIHRKCI